MSRVFAHSITVLNAPETPNGRGGVTRNWATATTAVLPGWAVDAGDTSEDTENREATEVAYTLRGPLSAAVASDNRVALFGEQFEVVGAVLRQPGPSPRTSHTILRLKKAVG